MELYQAGYIDQNKIGEEHEPEHANKASWPNILIGEVTQKQGG